MFKHEAETRKVGFATDFDVSLARSIVTDPKRFWSGTNINPYPVLKTGQLPQ